MPRIAQGPCVQTATRMGQTCDKDPPLREAVEVVDRRQPGPNFQAFSSFTPRTVPFCAEPWRLNSAAHLCWWLLGPSKLGPLCTQLHSLCCPSGFLTLSLEDMIIHPPGTGQASTMAWNDPSFRFHMHHWEGPGPDLKPLTSVGGGIGPVALVGLHHRHGRVSEAQCESQGTG